MSDNNVLAGWMKGIFLSNVVIELSEIQYDDFVDIAGTMMVEERQTYTGLLEFEYELDDSEYDKIPPEIRIWREVFNNHDKRYDIGIYKGVSLMSMSCGLEYSTLRYTLKLALCIDHIDQVGVDRHANMYNSIGDLEPSIATPYKTRKKQKKHFAEELFEV